MSNMLETLWEQTMLVGMVDGVTEKTQMEHKRSFFLGISAAKIVFDSMSGLGAASVAIAAGKFERDLKESISMLFPDDEYDAPKH